MQITVKQPVVAKFDPPTFTDTTPIEKKPLKLIEKIYELQRNCNIQKNQRASNFNYYNEESFITWFERIIKEKGYRLVRKYEWKTELIGDEVLVWPTLILTDLDTYEIVSATSFPIGIRDVFKNNGDMISRQTGQVIPDKSWFNYGGAQTYCARYAWKAMFAPNIGGDDFEQAALLDKTKVITPKRVTPLGGGGSIQSATEDPFGV